MRLQVVERYRRVLSAYFVDVFGWNLPEERIVCLSPYINSKTITLTWLTPEICERHLLAPPQGQGCSSAQLLGPQPGGLLGVDHPGRKSLSYSISYSGAAENGVESCLGRNYGGTVCGIVGNFEHMLFYCFGVEDRKLNLPKVNSLL